MVNLEKCAATSTGLVDVGLVTGVTMNTRRMRGDLGLGQGDRCQEGQGPGHNLEVDIDLRERGPTQEGENQEAGTGLDQGDQVLGDPTAGDGMMTDPSQGEDPTQGEDLTLEDQGDHTQEDPGVRDQCLEVVTIREETTVGEIRERRTMTGVGILRDKLVVGMLERVVTMSTMEPEPMLPEPEKMLSQLR